MAAIYAKGLRRWSISACVPLVVATMLIFSRSLRATAGFLIFCVAAPVFSASTIAPVIIDVPADGRAIVTVTNDRDRAVLYQLTALNWQVIDGQDRYENTLDFIASPPLFTLAAAETRSVRIGFRSAARAPVERAYRLVVAEVPGVTGASEEGGVINFAIQFLLPVYVAADHRDAKPELVWSMHAADNAVVLRAENVGLKRITLTAVGLSADLLTGAEPELLAKKPTTVLAKTWREWRIAVPPEKASLPWRIVYLSQGSVVPMVVPDAKIRAGGSR